MSTWPQGQWYRPIVFFTAAVAVATAGRTVQAAETTTYVLTDAQGTVLAREDAHGTVIATYDYRPYGKQQTGVATAGPGYTGHVTDVGSGFVYMQARYYDPDAGAFLSVDPVSFAPGGITSFNRYLYANGNPIRNVDRDGKWPRPAFLDVRILNSALNESWNDNVADPAGRAIAAIDRNVEITQSAGAAAGLVGASGEQNLLHPERVSLRYLMGEGASYSIDMAQKSP